MTETAPEPPGETQSEPVESPEEQEGNGDEEQEDEEQG
jgi:hypothetical protein